MFSNLLKSKPSSSDLLTRFNIPEPTKSLLWITDEETRMLVNPDSMTIKFDLKTKTSITIRDGESIYAEPSLIWTKLPIEENTIIDTNIYNYSFGHLYSALTPQQRFHYLTWLQNITESTLVNFPFIYYLGLERHLFMGDFDISSREAIRLLQSQHHLGFQYYALPSFLFASLYRGKSDIVKNNKFLLEHPTNIGFYLQYKSGISVFSKQIMKLAREVGFNNTLYIKKYPDLFETELQKKLDSYQVENENIFEICNMENPTRKSQARIDNRSIPYQYRNLTVPDIIGHSTFKFLMLDLLTSTHQTVKDLTLKRSTSKKDFPSLPKKAKRGKVSTSKVNYQEGTIVKENLPYPYVYYPGAYGTFFGFKKELRGELFFCSCSKKAIQNFIRLRLSQRKEMNTDKSKMYILSSRDFPQEIVSELMRKNIPENETVIDYLPFADKLCHECNKATPSLAYTQPMYGGLFEQKYGWYIHKEYYEVGITQGVVVTPYLKDTCPPEMAAIIDKKTAEYERIKSETTKDGQNMNNFTLVPQMMTLNRPLEIEIENRVRSKFGHKNVGEAWTGETILFYLVKELFPSYEVIHHFRPKYLEGLEFDIYIKELNLAFEYQGIQHFTPVEHWGGEDSLKKLQERDKKKNQLAKQMDIPIIYINYDDELTDKLVRNRIKPYLKN